MKLIYETTGKEVQSGDIAHDFRGKPAVVTGWQLPAHEGSTGRVHIKEMTDNACEGTYYPSVYGMKWVS